MVPFLLQAGVSMAAYTGGLAAAQVRAALLLPFGRLVPSSSLPYPTVVISCHPHLLQAAGMALRVSCATPIAGPIGGLLGVGLASAAAGQASIKCRQYLQDRQ